MTERRNKHGQLMCSCQHEHHQGRACPNEATMNNKDHTYFRSGRCTSCELGRYCRD